MSLKILNVKIFLAIKIHLDEFEIIYNLKLRFRWKRSSFRSDFNIVEHSTFIAPLSSHYIAARLRISDKLWVRRKKKSLSKQIDTMSTYDAELPIAFYCWS